MQFSTYAAFRTAVQVLIDGDDVSQSDLATSTLDAIIGAGELRVYRDLRSSTQDVALTGTVTSNVYTLPSDYLELKTLYVTGYRPPTYIPYEQMQQLIQEGANTSNGPLRYSFQGDTIIFYPSLATGATISGRYYKRFADISTAVNTFLNRHPDVFIYAALSESAPFLGENDRLPIWEQKYIDLVRAANEQERRRVTRGSKLAIRVA